MLKRQRDYVVKDEQSRGEMQRATVLQLRCAMLYPNHVVEMVTSELAMVV